MGRDGMIWMEKDEIDGWMRGHEARKGGRGYFFVFLLSTNTQCLFTTGSYFINFNFLPALRRVVVYVKPV